MLQADHLRSALIMFSDALACTPNMTDEQRDVLVRAMRRAATVETLTEEIEREIFRALLAVRIRTTPPFDPAKWEKFISEQSGA